jgi:hypothetical protein
MSPAKETHSPYTVHPGVAIVQKWIEELPGKTGRSLEEWIALTKKSGPATEKERREWLKKEHKLGSNSAAWIAERLEGKGGGLARRLPENRLRVGGSAVLRSARGAASAV